jgi:phage terminase large subunit
MGKHDKGLFKAQAKVAPVYAPLIVPARYKGAHGGRGSGKSHFFAEQLIVRCVRETTRCVCVREVQNTLKESVRLLLVDKIRKLNLEWAFEILDAEIRSRINGSLIIFRGMKSYSADNIKSLEGFDIAWVEEAQTFSKRSMKMLRPTFRKPGAEMWFSWNPRHETDAVDEFFRSSTPFPGSVCVEAHCDNNPWFPSDLKIERNYDYLNDPEAAAHVWGGGYEFITEGAYYARHITKAENEGRIGDFPYDPNLVLETAWDIGVDDYTAIWFIQNDGEMVTVVDYYEASGDGVPQIVTACMPELIPDKLEAKERLDAIGRVEPYRYDMHYLPHDVKVREWGPGAKERSLTLMEHGVKPIHPGVAAKPDDRIASVRALLPRVRFNRTTRVMKGVNHLRRYGRKFNEMMGFYTGIDHNLHSHAADAFGEYAVNNPIADGPKVEDKPKPLFKSMKDMTFDELHAIEERAIRRERV